MADFLTSLILTKGKEGKYSNHPKDPGGETVWGKARAKDPGWWFWNHFDGLKEQMGPVKACDDPETLAAIRGFYEKDPAGPWVRIRGAEISCQWIADEMFDTATNAYWTEANRFLQRTLNCLNRSDLAGGPLWDEMKMDGQLGPKTMASLNTALARGMGKDIWKYLNVLQGGLYFTLAEKDPKFEAFFRGWSARVFERDLKDFR